MTANNAEPIGTTNMLPPTTTTYRQVLMLIRSSPMCACQQHIGPENLEEEPSGKLVAFVVVVVPFVFILLIINVNCRQKLTTG